MATPISNASTSELSARNGRRLLRGALAGFASALALAIAPAAHAQTACDADINADGVVDSSDLGAVLSGWGACPDCVSDLNDDGVVDSSDLGALLSLWGAVCNPVDWATLIEFAPDPAVVADPALRSAIAASGYPWRVRDNATEIEMVLVPAGSFDMGCSPSSASACAANENPVHAVSMLAPFYIGRYEVTQAQWFARMGSNPSQFQAASEQVPAKQVPNRPVDNVSWSLVQTFLADTGLRLPTEAEWEFAYRAGTTTAYHAHPGFPNGTNNAVGAATIAWLNSNAVGQTRPVGQRPANTLGLHDMPGNVWEWVSDWYDAAYYASSPSTNPQGPATGTLRVVRGGSWNSGSEWSRSSARGNAAPGLALGEFGFRVVRSALPAPVLDGVFPSTGSSGGGTFIELSGSNLSGAVSVTIGGIAATDVTVVNPSFVTAVTPAGSIGPKDVSITTPAGTATLPNAFTYGEAAPTIIATTPGTGPTTGNTLVTITGTNLGSTHSVFFGSFASPAVTVVSPTTVTALTPANAPGTVTVALLAANGTAARKNAFLYQVPAPSIQSIAPNVGPISGGTVMTINGTNLSGTVSVTVGGGSAVITSVSPTVVTAATPQGAPGTATVSLTTPGGTTVLPNGFTYQVAAPTITSISPNTGGTTGGLFVTIAGTNLGGTSSVRFGGTSASIIAITPTSVTAVTPAGSPGAVTVSVTTNGGIATLPNGFTYQSMSPSITSVTPNAGPWTGGTTITITGVNLTGTQWVRLGNTLASNVTVVSSTKVTAVTPPGLAGPTSVTLQTANGQATLPNAFTYQ